MESDWQRVVTDNMDRLMNNLYPDHVVDRLLARGVLSVIIWEEINTLPTRRDKLKLIISRVIGQGPRAIQVFIHGLKQDEYELYKQLCSTAGKYKLTLQVTDGRLPLTAPVQETAGQGPQSVAQGPQPVGQSPHHAHQGPHPVHGVPPHTTSSQQTQRKTFQ